MSRPTEGHLASHAVRGLELGAVPLGPSAAGRRAVLAAVAVVAAITSSAASTVFYVLVVFVNTIQERSVAAAVGLSGLCGPVSFVPDGHLAQRVRHGGHARGAGVGTHGRVVTHGGDGTGGRLGSEKIPKLNKW